MAATMSSQLNTHLTRLDELIASGNLDLYAEQCPLTVWQSQLDCARSWAASVNANDDCVSPLEYRLRDASHVREHVTWLVNRLGKWISRLSQLLNPGSSTDEGNIDVKSDSNGDKKMDSEIKHILHVISKIIAGLCQSSAAIREAVPQDRLVFVAKENWSADWEPNRKYIVKQFPQADTSIVERLAGCVSRQRAMLRYRRTPLASGTQLQPPHEIALHFSKLKIMPEPSTQNPRPKSASSALTESPDDQASPPLPPGYSENSDFQCPYCHIMVSITNRASWTQHVFDDLLPYICVKDDCDTPSKAYANRDDWYQHMMDMHGFNSLEDIWDDCPLCKCSLQKLNLKDHLAHHLESLALLSLSHTPAEENADTFSQTEKDNRDRLLLAFGKFLEHLAKKEEEEKPRHGDIDVVDEPREPPTFDGEGLEGMGTNDAPGIGQQRKPGEDSLGQGPMVDSPITPGRSRSPKGKGRALDPVPEQSPSDLDAWNLQLKIIGESLERSLREHNYCERGNASKLPFKKGSQADLEAESTIKHGVSRSNFQLLRKTDGRTKSSPEHCGGVFFECDACHAVLHGESEAENHCIGTGHTSFVDVSDEPPIGICPDGRDSAKGVPIDSGSSMSPAERRAFRKRLWDDYPESLGHLDDVKDIFLRQNLNDTLEPTHRQMLEVMETIYGKEAQTVLVLIPKVAPLFETQGKYWEAIKLYERALNGNMRYLGRLHPNTLKIMLSLGKLFHEIDQQDRAEEYLSQAASGFEKILGGEDITTLRCLRHLAMVLEARYKREGVESLYTRALNGMKRELGPTDPETLETLQNLAMFLQKQERYEEAEQLHRQALEGCEAQFGHDKPETLRCLFNLSRVIYQQERYDEAQSLYRQALEGRDKIFHNDTEDSLTWVFDQGKKFRHAGKLRASEDLTRRSAEGFERLLGKDHPQTLGSLQSMGIALRHQLKFAEAEKVIKRVIEGLERANGTNHYDTQKALQNLGNLYGATGRYQTAEKIMMSGLVYFEKTLGRDHPDTIACFSNLSETLRAQGRNVQVSVEEYREKGISCLGDLCRTLH